MCGRTTVVNIRDLDPGWRNEDQYVYIGRMNRTYRLAESKFNNPHAITAGLDRDESIDKFRRDFIWNKYLQEAALQELTNKTLVCWCKPKACHGDVLAEFVNTHAQED